MPQMRNLSRELYDKFLYPVEGKFADQNELIIITDRYLSVIPFETLIDKNGETYNDISDILKNMGNNIPSYSDISLFKLGDQGYNLNGSIKT